MKYSFLTRFIFCGCLLLFIGCSSSPKQTPPGQPASDQKEIDVAAENPVFFEGTLIAPGVDFSRYKKILITGLDMDDIQMVAPEASGIDGEWKLTKTDKRILREQYTTTVVTNLIADGAYSTALGPAEDVILLKTKILRIAPLKQSADSRQAEAMKMYSDGSVAMTVAMELFDADSQKLIGAITKTSDIGRLWNENNKSSAYKQSLTAFDNWLRLLRTELDAFSRRQTPLEKLLR